MESAPIARLLSADWPAKVTDRPAKVTDQPGDSAPIHVAQCADVPEAAVITLNRPESHNAIRLAMWPRLADAVTELARDHRVVVIRGAGRKAFSAGADIEEFPDVRLDAHGALTYSRAVAGAIDAIRGCPVPVIAMIHGLAVGGGCEIAAACDVRIADSSARVGIPIVRLGVTLGVTEARAVVDLIGPGKTRYLLLSGRIIDADEAARIGLLDVVVPPAELAAETEALVHSVAAASPAAVTAAKRIVGVAAAGIDRHYPETFAEELFSVYEGPRLREGVRAFGARRSTPRTEEKEDRR